MRWASSKFLLTIKPGTLWDIRSFNSTRKCCSIPWPERVPAFTSGVHLECLHPAVRLMIQGGALHALSEDRVAASGCYRWNSSLHLAYTCRPRLGWTRSPSSPRRLALSGRQCKLTNHRASADAPGTTPEGDGPPSRGYPFGSSPHSGMTWTTSTRIGTRPLKKTHFA